MLSSSPGDSLSAISWFSVRTWALGVYLLPTKFPQCQTQKVTHLSLTTAAPRQCCGSRAQLGACLSEPDFSFLDRSIISFLLFFTHSFSLQAHVLFSELVARWLEEQVRPGGWTIWMALCSWQTERFKEYHPFSSLSCSRCRGQPGLLHHCVWGTQ